MSRTIGPPITLLSTADADVDQNNASWVSLEGPDEVLFDLAIVGANTATLDFSHLKDGVVSSNNAFTANNSLLVTSPVGNVRVWSNNIAANESAVVTMIKIYHDNR